MNPHQQPSKRKKMEDIWDLSVYTDDEIIQNLLNMSNPTDRELEIKIWSTINQYKLSPPTEETNKWIKFYEQIYERLFSFSDDEENASENEDDPPPTSKDKNAENLENFIAVLEPQPPSHSAPSVKEGLATTEDDTKLVTTLQYASGNINPLLKETITRTLTIDSSYRDNKNEQTTNFILNLTETIKNVVSIKLYSVHIPFTWYTISTDFGSNYFYIKAISPGIADGNHDYKISISSGNYNQNALATSINASLATTFAENPDVSFGNTQITYNANSSTMSITLDIQNIFNESNYYLDFINTPSQIDGEKNKTIPAFLGFNDVSYSLFAINSNLFPNTTNTTSIYTISNTTDLNENRHPNNEIWIYQYLSTATTPSIYSQQTAQIVATYSMTIPSGSYSRNSLASAIQAQIQSANFLNQSLSSIQIKTENQSNAYFNLQLILNKSTTKNQQYLNTVILLPDDSNNNNIWTGPCMNFDGTKHSSIPLYPLNSTTKLPDTTQPTIGSFFPFYYNELISENATAQTNYVIGPNTQIIFDCTLPYYNVLENKYYLTVTPSTVAKGYILPDYVAAINNAFEHPINAATNQDIFANNIFNTTINGQPFTIGTDSIPRFTVDLNKIFTQDAYRLDISGPLYNILNISYNGHTAFNLIDLSSNTGKYLNSKYSIDFSFGYTADYDLSCSSLLTLLPTTTTPPYGNQNTPPAYINPVYTANSTANTPTNTLYNNIQVLQSDINSAFLYYTDSILNTNPLQNCKIHINPTILSISTTENTNIYYYEGTIAFTITNTITEYAYTMAFYDKLNSWSNYLHFSDNSGESIATDISYELMKYNVEGQSYSEISGNDVVLNQIILIDETNQSFRIVPRPEITGLQSTSNIYTYDIPIGSYTRDQLISAINTKFQSIAETQHCTLSLITINSQQNSQLNIYVNKVFTASDYSLVFYDNTNFKQCTATSGIFNIGNASWDSTLGWILGFREYTTYVLSDYSTAPTSGGYLNNTAIVTGDTTCTTTLYNYFILKLDDYNQNHTNDGLVTITTFEKNIPLPSYANRSNFVCDINSGQYIYTGITAEGSNRLTQNQIYSITQIMNESASSKTIDNNLTTRFSKGPFISDVLAIIPVKTAGVQNGQTLIFDGGTLQTQSRQYFGPINLNRLSITLYDDHGHVVNLNNSNWSFTLLVDQIYKKSAPPSTK